MYDFFWREESAAKKYENHKECNRFCLDSNPDSSTFLFYQASDLTSLSLSSLS